MITIDNYTAETKNIDFSKMPNALQGGNKYFLEYGDLYNDDADIKSTIDLYLKQLNAKVEEKKDEPVKVRFVRKDNWGRSIYKTETGKVYVDVDNNKVLYSMTEEGEPLAPVKGNFVFEVEKQKPLKAKFQIDEPVVYKDKHGQYTLLGNVVKIFPQDGITVYDVKGMDGTSGTYTADELRTPTKVVKKMEKSERNKKKVAAKKEEKKSHRETEQEKKKRIVNAEQFIKDVEGNANLKNLTETQVIGIGLQFETNYRSYLAQKRDEKHDTKKRLSPTPENLIRWMKAPGHFDLIGVDTFQRTDASADYKREISKQKFWNNIFNLKV